MIEKGIRGGVSSIMKRYSKANHKYLDDYDPEKPSQHILYLDANNLYGWAMSKPQPYKNFRWMKEEELKNWESKPCFLEVDLEYPKELHDKHNEYPFFYFYDRQSQKKKKKKIHFWYPKHNVEF